MIGVRKLRLRFQNVVPLSRLWFLSPRRPHVSTNTLNCVCLLQVYIKCEARYYSRAGREFPYHGYLILVNVTMDKATQIIHTIDC
jgi:hypothetical protein